MARVTVEDCIKLVPNRFDLVLLAAQRAKELSSGAMLTVQRDKDKNPVVALREIAEQTVSTDTLRESVIVGMQKNVLADDSEEGLDALLAEDQLLAEEYIGDTGLIGAGVLPEEDDDTDGKSVEEEMLADDDDEPIEEDDA